jgi:2,4-dienoyl-CoA reductase-like NADH-dependent reductase (Old Yellow Enzyme family)/NADPH-dependent 2,4-dienoyl-CoA reductase/sulfur reductase-like enzyme
MISNFCDGKGFLTERFKAFYEAKAKGGFGLLIVESFGVSQEGLGFPLGPRIDDDKFIPEIADLANRLHRYGAKCILQLSHCGAQTSSQITGFPPMAPSSVPANGTFEIPVEMSVADIQLVMQKYADAAVRSKTAGFDGVEMHIAHGYLLNEFVSLYANKRTDRYGGCMVNRLRIVKEIMEHIRQRCGPDFVITVRISAKEGVDSGHSLADIRAMAILLEKYGADALNLSAGNYHNTLTIPDYHTDHGWLAEYVGTVKKVVSLPVIVAGRITDPIVAEGIIAAGLADFVAMARASLADPELPNKAGKGDFESICPCIGCMLGCVDNLMASNPLRCLVNPSLGYEYKNELKKTASPKHVMVVGGGPAGIQAAIASAQSGHKVALFERMAMLGGNFLLAAYPPAKGEIAAYISWGRNQLEMLGVQIRLGAEVTIETIRNNKPDSLIVATGAEPAMFPLEGIHGEQVLPAGNVLTGKSVTGPRVVVAGGGMVGLETALYLAKLGRMVTVMEALPEVARDMGSTKHVLLQNLAENKVNIHVHSKICRFTEQGVFYLHHDKEEFYPCDNAVLAFGYSANAALAEQARDMEIEVIVVGDAEKVGNALEAGRRGFLAGAGILETT